MSVVENIEYLVRPRSIAFVGATEKNIGNMTYNNLMRLGYQGKVFFVHPKRDEVLGNKAYRTIADIPDEVDCCVLVLRASLIPGYIPEMKAKGAKAAVIFASGFSEMGAEGRKLENEVASLLAESEIAACGANCLGLINLVDNIPLYSAPIDAENCRGPICMVAHSGSACIGMMSTNRGTGYSYLISCGNEAGVKVPQYYDFMMNDASTKVLAGYLEAIRNPEMMAEVAKKSVEYNKPIVLMLTGRSAIGQRTASAHSGALASSSVVVEAFCRRNHILTVKSFDEQAETLELLSKLKDYELVSDKIGCTAISGGQLGFTCDVAADEGVEFAQISQASKDRLRAVLPDFATANNPLDVTTALFDPEAYKECVRAIADDPETGLILVCQDAESNMAQDEKALYNAIATAMVEVQKEISKPIIVFSPISDGFYPEFAAILKEGNIPLLQGAHSAMRAVKLLIQWDKYRKEYKAEKADNVQICDVKPCEFPAVKALSERESKDILAQYGLPVAKNILAKSADEAVAAAEAAGYPVVMKVDSPDIMHKTEAKAVVVGVKDAAGVKKAFEDIMANSKAYAPNAVINGVAVQEMVPYGLEVMVGAKNDPKFGPTVMVGIGGIFVEVFKDFSLEIAPVSETTARAMIENLKGAKLFHGARGAAEADVDALVDFIVKFSRMVYANRDRISEVDVNPVIVLPKGQGCKAVDGLIVLKD